MSFTPDTLISTLSGKLEGKRNADSGTLSWLGIPYAQAPVGILRWKAPHPIEPWNGVLKAEQYGNSCIQIVNGEVTGSEDCLYLNIWRPDDVSCKLPVLLFVHDGGNMSGSGQDFKGELLAKATNSIVITINYRLGAMGFFRHPVLTTGNPIDDSGNYGLLDILHALKWVQDHIEPFGGDPGNVTLSGQSAGGRNVLAALISPLGLGLFQKAVVLSGGMTAADPVQGEAKSVEVLAKLLVQTGKVQSDLEAQEWIKGQQPEIIAAFLRDLDAKQYADIYGQVVIQMDRFPHLFTDGTVIPADGFKRIDDGRYAKVPIILGSTATEFSGFALSDPNFLSHLIDGSLFKDSEKSKLFAASVNYGSSLYARFNAERIAERLIAQSDQPPVFVYRFAWGTRVGVIDPTYKFMVGAIHGADLMFYTGDDVPTLINFPKGISPRITRADARN